MLILVRNLLKGYSSNRILSNNFFQWGEIRIMAKVELTNMCMIYDKTNNKVLVQFCEVRIIHII